MRKNKPIAVRRVCEWLFAGARPANLEDLLHLQTLGVKVLLDLESGVHEALNDDFYESADLEDFGMTRVRIRCSDVTPMSKADLEFALTVVRITRNELRTVYVHCRTGKDRTGKVVAYCRRKILGWARAACMKMMISEGFHLFPYTLWLPTIWRRLK